MYNIGPQYISLFFHDTRVHFTIMEELQAWDWERIVDPGKEASLVLWVDTVGYMDRLDSVVDTVGDMDLLGTVVDTVGYMDRLDSVVDTVADMVLFRTVVDTVFADMDLSGTVVDTIHIRNNGTHSCTARTYRMLISCNMLNHGSGPLNIHIYMQISKWLRLNSN